MQTRTRSDTAKSTSADVVARVPRSRIAFVTVCVLGVLVAVLALSALIFHVSGGRWFIITSPSMGQTAPVGSLVLSTSTPVGNLHAGDVITFHPPTAPAEIYTHRIYQITSNGAILTKGDINGAIDPWQLHHEDIIGQATGLFPGLGWAIRAAPFLLIGFIGLWVLTRLFASATWRYPLRIIGASVVVAATAFILHPLVDVIVLTTNTYHRVAHATVVSTGILPIRIQAHGGSHTDLTSGMVGHVTIPSLVDTGHYQLSSTVHLTLIGWILMGLVCATPLLWCLIVGLPPADTDGEEPLA